MPIPVAEHGSEASSEKNVLDGRIGQSISAHFLFNCDDYISLFVSFIDIARSVLGSEQTLPHV